MKNSILIGIFCLFLFACQKDEPPAPELSDLTGLNRDQNFEKLIENDFLIFQALLDRDGAQIPRKGAESKAETKISSAEEFSDYFKNKGYHSEDLPDLMIKSTRLTAVIFEKYGILSRGNEELEFTRMYNERFTQRVKSYRDQISFKHQGNRVKVEDLSATCAEVLVTTWNENASNYRRNAAACIALPGPLGTACIYLAGVALERQQEEAYGEYRECMGWVNPE